MSVNTMTRRVIPPYGNQRYEYDETLTYVDTELTSDPLIFPGGDTVFTATLYIDTGSGKIQTTNNKYDDVLSDTDVVWTDWDSGSVTITIQDTFDASVTAIRFICTTGTVRLMATAQ